MQTANEILARGVLYVTISLKSRRLFFVRKHEPAFQRACANLCSCSRSYRGIMTPGIKWLTPRRIDKAR